MIKKLLEWLLSFFQTKEEKKINQKIEDIDDKIEEIKKSSMTDQEIEDYLNK